MTNQATDGLIGQPRTLWAITADVQELEALLYETGGDITDADVERQFDSWFLTLGVELTRKIDNYCNLIAELEARGGVRQEAAARLDKLGASDLAAGKRLRARLKAWFEGTKRQKLDTPHWKLWLQGTGGKQGLVLDPGKDVNDYPEKYRKLIPARYELDTDLLRQDLTAGIEIPGATLAQRGTVLRIK